MKNTTLSVLHRIGAAVRWGHQLFAINLANLLILFVALNLVCWASLPILNRRIVARMTSQNASYYPTKDNYAPAYPGLAWDRVSAMLQETYSRPLQYDPFTNFREGPFRGKYVNVNKAGFRYSRDQGPWPPNPACINIFMFGGSTAFGYGVTDDETVPSQLQDALQSAEGGKAVRMYNFGVASFYSSQELAYFVYELRSGFVPDIVVFLDGINDFHIYQDEPQWTDVVRAVFTEHALHHHLAAGILEQLRGLALAMPMGAFAQKLRFLMTPEETVHAAPKLAVGMDESSLENVVMRYLRTKEIEQSLARSFGVESVFVWQPTPEYKYNAAQYHFLKPSDFWDNNRSRLGYALAAKIFGERKMGDNFVWLADIQENRTDNLYVDAMHYTAAFSREIAHSIAERISLPAKNTDACPTASSARR